MKIQLIRHGKTEGNKDKRYLGITDEGLCEEGRAEIEARYLEGRYTDSKLIYVSPMKRCLETADIIFKDREHRVVEDMRECNFGTFEYKNHVEMNGQSDYQEWLDSNGTKPFPGGESLLSFQERCVKAFYKTIEALKQSGELTGREDETITFVVHGGTIMAIMSGISQDKVDYFNFMCDNGRGYLFDWEDETCLNIQQLQ